MKISAYASLLLTTAVTFSGCGGGGASEGGYNTNIPSAQDIIDAYENNETNTTITTDSKNLVHFRNTDNDVTYTDDNAKSLNEPDYTLIAVEYKTFNNPDFTQESGENNTHTKELYLDAGGSVLSSLEWNRGTLTINGFELENLIAVKGTDKNHYILDYNTADGVYRYGDTEYRDYDHPENDFNISRDIYITDEDNNNIYVLVKSTKSDEVQLEIAYGAHEYNQYRTLSLRAKFKDEASFIDTFENNNTNYETIEAFIGGSGNKFNDGYFQFQDYKGNGFAKIAYDYVYDENGMFTNFVETFRKNYDGSLEIGTVNNPLYANHKNMVQTGEIGDGYETTLTKPMWEVLSCDVSGDSYAVKDGAGYLKECHEDLDGDSIIDRTTEYTWLDQWRLEKVTTTEGETTTVNEFQYYDFGNISRKITYVNGQYVSHNKYYYNKNSYHIFPN